jgi:uncharacterized protein YaiI (UPF0178 family)
VRTSVTPAPNKTITIYVDADACPVKQEVYRVAERHGLKGYVVSNSPIAVPREYLIGGRPDAEPGATSAGRPFVVGGRPDAEPEATSAGRPFVERIVVAAGMDVADDWIAERAAKGAIVVTQDIPLAARAVKAGAVAIAPNGKPFSESSIGMTLATRNLMDSLRSAGEVTGGPKPFSPKDRSAFLGSLDREIVRLKREGFGAGS